MGVGVDAVVIGSARARFILEPQCNTKGTELKESSHEFYEYKYKAHFDNIFYTVGSNLWETTS
jgi:hypothetical protein